MIYIYKVLQKIKIYGEYVILVFASVIMLFPFYWMVVSALKTRSEVVQFPPTMVPREITFDNFLQVFDRVDIFQYMSNSLFVAIVGTVLCLIVSLLAGFALSYYSFKGKKIICYLLICVSICPFEILTIINFKTIVSMGLFDTIWGLIFPFVGDAFYALYFKSRFDSMSSSLVISTIIDGSKPVKSLFKIYIPSAKSSIITAALLNFISSWNSLVWPVLIIKSPENRTIPFGIYSFISDGGEHIELLMALSVISLVPMVALFFISRKFLLSEYIK